MSPNIDRILVVVMTLGAATSLACSSTTTVAPSDGGSDAGSGDGAASGSSSCGEAVTCITGCPDNDQACYDACYAKASPGGQQKLVALVDCINAQQCADATCTKTKCGTELSACLDDVAVTVDSGIPPTTGSPLPASLVGSWSHVSGSYGTNYTFNANGTYSSVFLYDNSGACITIRKLSTAIDGVAATSGDTLVVTAKSGTATTTDCSDTITTKPSQLPTTQYTWSVTGTTLTLTNADGATDYTKQ